jgi:hypothetical protein
MPSGLPGQYAYRDRIPHHGCDDTECHQSDQPLRRGRFSARRIVAPRPTNCKPGERKMCEAMGYQEASAAGSLILLLDALETT